VLDDALVVQEANRSFFGYFRISRSAVISHKISDIGRTRYKFQIGRTGWNCGENRQPGLRHSPELTHTVCGALHRADSLACGQKRRTLMLEDYFARLETDQSLRQNALVLHLPPFAKSLLEDGYAIRQYSADVGSHRLGCDGCAGTAALTPAALTP
jgi:hypothetical protein